MCYSLAEKLSFAHVLRLPEIKYRDDGGNFKAAQCSSCDMSTVGCFQRDLHWESELKRKAKKYEACQKKEAAVKLGQKRMWLTKRLAFFKKTSTLHKKDNLKTSQTLGEPYHLQIPKYRGVNINSFKDFALRREPQVSLLENVHLGNWFTRIHFIMFRHPGMQRLLLPWSKGVQIRFELAADITVSST